MLKRKPETKLSIIPRNRKSNTFRSIAMAAMIAVATIFPNYVGAKSRKAVPARKEEKGQKNSLNVKLGVGYSSLQKTPRIFSVISGSIPLPYELTLSCAIGAAALNRKVQIEETYLGATWKATRSLSLNGGVYTSIHLATDRASPLGWVSMRLPGGWIISPGYLYWRDGGQHWAYIRIDKTLLKGKIAPFLKSGWTWQDGWFFRAGISAGSFSSDIQVCGKGGDATLSSSVFSLNWKIGN